MAITTSAAVDTGSRFGDLIYFRYEFIFSPSGYVHVIDNVLLASQAEADADLLAREASVEAEVVEQSRDRARSGLLSPGAPELVTPDFPDELPGSDSDVGVDTRRRGFHRWLLRWVWPLDMLLVAQYWLPIWLWIEQMTGPNARTYLDVDVATFNSISQRMGNVVTVSGLWDADEPGEIP
jgi:hypothetical protein